MSLVFAIDPGTTLSGWVLYRSSTGRVEDSGVHPNADLLRWIQAGQDADILAIEMFASMGMVVGREVFETVRWIGRMQQAWREPDAVRLVYRQQIKLGLCGTPRAKDANVRQALIDLLGAPGLKRAPGPTYGVTSHAWQALGVAIIASRLGGVSAAAAGQGSTERGAARLGPPEETAGLFAEVSTPHVGTSGEFERAGSCALAFASVGGNRPK